MDGMTVHDYTHPPEPSRQEPDPRPGLYYVSVSPDGRPPEAATIRLALGPFHDHAAALARVDECRDFTACRGNAHDRRLATWGAWGTCRLDPFDYRDTNPPIGALNSHLHLQGGAADTTAA